MLFNSLSEVEDLDGVTVENWAIRILGSDQGQNYKGKA